MPKASTRWYALQMKVFTHLDVKIRSEYMFDDFVFNQPRGQLSSNWIVFQLCLSQLGETINMTLEKNEISYL